MNTIQLSLMTRVISISLVYHSNNEEKTFLHINTIGWHLRAFPELCEGMVGNCILISDNKAKMEQLKGLLELANYDIFYDKFKAVSTINLIGSNGPSDMCSHSLFVRVNGTNPDKLFK